MIGFFMVLVITERIIWAISRILLAVISLLLLILFMTWIWYFSQEAILFVTCISAEGIFWVFTIDTNIFCIYGLFGIFHNIFFRTLDCVRPLGKNLVRFGYYVLKDMFTNAFLCSCFLILFCGLGNLSFSKMLDELRTVEICNKRNFAHELKYKSLFLLSHSCNNTLYFICITSCSVLDIKT